MMGTELGTWSRGTSASGTLSNAAMSDRNVFECATLIMEFRFLGGVF